MEFKLIDIKNGEIILEGTTLDTEAFSKMIGYIRVGNVIKTEKDYYYLVVKVYGKIFLVNIETGNRWNDNGLEMPGNLTLEKINSHFSGLRGVEVLTLEEYVEDRFVTELEEECPNCSLKNELECCEDNAPELEVKELEKVIALSVAKSLPNDTSYRTINRISKDVLDFLKEENYVKG